MQNKPAGSPRTSPQPTLTRDEVLKIFRERASDTERREFERLRGLTDAESQDRALQTVLFRLTGDDLYALDIVAVQVQGETDWAVAWSLDSPEIMQAVDAAFAKAGVQGGASGDLGHAGWYVPREQFFRAR
jgi:hypothetical protein